ncbi:MAG: right-handed parallel beta-helix repeat-containing protein, partial [Acidimicrobiales bacterium]
MQSYQPEGPLSVTGRTGVPLNRLAHIAGAVAMLLASVGGALVLGVTPAAATASITLYVSTGGSSASSNKCETSSSPCLTIQHAVDQAELLTGAVVIQIAGGTYAEQVTIAPQSGSPMTSLTLQGPTSGTVAVVQPATLVANVTEGNTGHFFDDNTGKTAAILGVQTGSADTAAGNTSVAGSPATVTVSNLTVDGSGLTSTGSGPWEGIAFIDTSGAITHNAVKHIEQAATIGDASVHGIEVKSTTAPQTVTVAGNTAMSEPGHVAIDLMAASPGVLSASVTGNALTGDPTASTKPASQFGIAAGGLSSLSISGNKISDFQSPWSVGAVWLDRQVSGATCSVTGNTLTANDNGVDVHGASGCTITGNTITAGSAGVEIGPAYVAKVPSDNTVVTSNTITGTKTIATAGVAGVPVDGVLVWGGTGSSITGNTVGGFASDIYVGEDPVYLNNTATWGSGGPDPFGGYFSIASLATSGTTVHSNDLGTPATPVSGSGVSSYGVACLNSNGDCSTSSLDATGNWWGSSSGPGPVGPGSGAPVSHHVTYSSWLVGTPLANPALTVVSGNGQSAPVGDLFPLALTVKATSNSKGAAGQYVKLGVPSSGASATVVTTNPAPTGPDGIAVFALRANNTTGTFTVTATW